MFENSQIETLTKALGIFLDPPTFEMGSWEQDDDTISIRDLVIQACDGDYALYRIKFHPGTRLDPPEQSEKEIKADASFTKIVDLLIQTIAHDKFIDITYEETY